ncbi:hypothetical protein [uncultured Lacinutrix sp.]|uniref:hypothetical protein n=1 Tax=uncultured Lacinutrix sp. TaxID=574032 RepID=UPI00261C15B2|nr:hypothetical protein [uncultured Lacinutrix sp.]
MKKYSKLSVLFLSLFVLVLSSCENEALEGFDSNDGNPFTNSLIGTWTLDDFTSSVNTSTVVNGMPIESDIAINGFNPNYNITFAQNTFSTSGDYEYSVDIDITGQPTMSNNYSLDNVSGAGVYSTNGNQMTVDGSFFEFNFQGVDSSIFEGEQTVTFVISNNGQTLTFSQNETQTNNTGGVSTTSTNISTSVWTKVNNNTNTACADATTLVSQAETAYNNDTSNVDLCNAYKSTLQNQINACGDSTGEIQTIIDGLGDCQDNTQPTSVEISVTTGTLNIEFDMVDVVVDGTTLKITGETSASNPYMIYFEVEEGATGMEIINSAFVLTLSTTDPDYFPNTAGVDDFTSTITENATGTLVGSFGGIVTNSTGGDLSLSQGVINIMY